MPHPSTLLTRCWSHPGQRIPANLPLIQPSTPPFRQTQPQHPTSDIQRSLQTRPRPHNGPYYHATRCACLLWLHAAETLSSCAPLTSTISIPTDPSSIAVHVKQLGRPLACPRTRTTRPFIPSIAPISRPEYDTTPPCPTSTRSRRPLTSSRPRPAVHPPTRCPRRLHRCRPRSASSLRTRPPSTPRARPPCPLPSSPPWHPLQAPRWATTPAWALGLVPCATRVP